jgi:hypothetical protein
MITFPYSKMQQDLSTFKIDAAYTASNWALASNRQERSSPIYNDAISLFISQ